MEFCNTLTPHYRLEHFESSMDLCPLESRKGFTDRNSISPLSESNRTVDECIHCNNRADYECTECTCQICGHKTKAAKRYRCFSCKKVFHEWCQNISDTTSTDHWQCMNCKPKDQLVPDNGLASVKFTRQIIIRTARKINNAPRSSECTIVPANHFGPIPNIPVGTCWEYRLQASEAGVHRPLVAGIHGRENEGAYSIVLSGVYPDDFDNGDEFFYSGCGGKEKDPSKRLGAQVRNQMLTKQNRALALCCDCSLNDKEGGSAKNWRAGKPVRVIRNYKLAKFSKYAPTEGNRYDGIYKVVKYFPQKGHSGYMIWRYLLKRDDPTPAPWTPEGKRLIEQLGLKMIRASPSIAEKAEEYESTFKLEINDDEPMKKKLKRVRRNESNCPVQKRPLQITISSPISSPKCKEEKFSPPSSPEAIKSEITLNDVKHSPSRLSNDNDYLPAEIKSSPTFDSGFTSLANEPEQIDEKPFDNYLHMNADRIANSFAEPVLPTLSGIAPAHAFSQSISSNLSYLDNVFIPPITLSKPTYIGNLTSTFSNHEKTYFVSNDVGVHKTRHPEPLPILKVPLSNLRPMDATELTSKPIKLTKQPKPIILRTSNPPMMESLPIDTFRSDFQDKPVALVVEKSGFYELSDHIKKLIGKDVLNKYWWDVCMEKYLSLGKQGFLDNIQQLFTCPCCHKIIDKPVTLRCEHSACLDCLNERFEILRVRSCPTCQEHLGPSIKLKINENLYNILLELFPAYNLKLSYFI